MLKTVFVLLLIGIGSAYADPASYRPAPSAGEPGQQPQAKPGSGQDDPASGEQATPPQANNPGLTQDEHSGFDYSSPDWWVAIFTGLLFLVALLQLAVFGRQAIRLRQTVEAAKAQAVDLQNSIAQATRAADAMVRIADRTEITGEKFQDFSKKQLRAYLSVSIDGGLYQDDIRHFEVRPLLFNSGGTPAHKMQYWARADILPIPLPDDFSFPEPEQKEAHSFVIGPRQGSTINAAVKDRVQEDIAIRAKRGHGIATYIWGIVSYEDEFGEPHWTKFCQYIYWVAAHDGERINGIYEKRYNETD